MAAKVGRCMNSRTICTCVFYTQPPSVRQIRINVTMHRLAQPQATPQTGPAEDSSEVYEPHRVEHLHSTSSPLPKTLMSLPFTWILNVASSATTAEASKLFR